MTKSAMDAANKKSPEFREIFKYFLEIPDDFLFSSQVIKRYSSIEKSRTRIFLSRLLNNPKKEPLLFIGAKYRGLMKAAKPIGFNLLGRPSHKAISEIYKAGFYSEDHLIAALYRAFSRRDESELFLAVDFAESLLLNWGTETILLINDSFPLERLFIVAARRAGVTSICMQHGLFSSKGALINDGKSADIICTYDKFQADILSSTGARNTYVFGYYEDVPDLSFEDRRNPVCIVGQPWVDYYKEKSNHYLHILEELISCLDNAKISWVYKPHPSEMEAWRYVPNYNSHKYEKKLKSAFRDFDVFLSATSTVLFEATLNGKLAIQIHCNELSSEKFSDYGYAISIPLREISRDLPEKILHGMPVKIAVATNDLPGRFKKLINSCKGYRTQCNI